MNTFEDHHRPDAAPPAPAPARDDGTPDGTGGGGALGGGTPDGTGGGALDGGAPDGTGGGALDERIVAALREVYDPEIPVNIYDLGLIYRIDCDDMGVVEIDMTLTAPGCPVAQTFPGTVEAAVQNVEGVAAAEVDLVWEPPWTPDRMSEAAKLELGFF